MIVMSQAIVRQKLVSKKEIIRDDDQEGMDQFPYTEASLANLETGFHPWPSQSSRIRAITWQDCYPA